MSEPTDRNREFSRTSSDRSRRHDDSYPRDLLSSRSSAHRRERHRRERDDDYSESTPSSKSRRTDHFESTETPHTTRTQHRKRSPSPPRADSKPSPPSVAIPAAQPAKPDEPLECGICLEPITLQGELDCCRHVFCFECIFRWSQTANTCKFFLVKNFCYICLL